MSFGIAIHPKKKNAKQWEFRVDHSGTKGLSAMEIARCQLIIYICVCVCLFFFGFVYVKRWRVNSKDESTLIEWRYLASYRCKYSNTSSLSVQYLTETLSEKTRPCLLLWHA